MAYEQVTGPIGPERTDMLHGILTAVIANAGRGKRGRVRRATDFIPRWDRVKKRLSGHQMLDAVRSINTALGGRTDDDEEGADDGGPRRVAGGDRPGHQRPDRRRRRRRG